MNPFSIAVCQIAVPPQVDSGGAKDFKSGLLCDRFGGPDVQKCIFAHLSKF